MWFAPVNDPAGAGTRAPCHRVGTRVHTHTGADASSRPTDPLAAVADLIARQAGVISRAQALAAGMSALAVDDRLRTRRWSPVHPRVYLERSYPLGPEARVRAAVLWAGPDAVLCGLAAAWWHGLTAEPPPVIGVAVPRARSSHRTRSGVSVRHRRHDAADVLEDRGVRLTTRGLSVLDAAVELGSRGAAFLDHALRAGVTFAELEAAHPATGSSTAARLLASARARSGAVATDRLTRLLLAARLCGWRPGPAHPGQAVALFPTAEVAVVVNGWVEPPDPPPVPAGWTRLHYSWRDLGVRSADVAAEIARVTRPRQRS